MTTVERGLATTMLLFFLLPFVVVGTWVNNLFDLMECDGKADYKCEIIHGAGLIPVVSVFTSFVDSDEERKGEQ